jgi:hypothetical protein
VVVNMLGLCNHMFHIACATYDVLRMYSDHAIRTYDGVRYVLAAILHKLVNTLV